MAIDVIRFTRELDTTSFGDDTYILVLPHAKAYLFGVRVPVMVAELIVELLKWSRDVR